MTNTIKQYVSSQTQVIDVALETIREYSAGTVLVCKKKISGIFQSQILTKIYSSAQYCPNCKLSKPQIKQ